MKHLGKVLVLSIVCGLTATLFVACGPNVNATIEESPAQENTIPTEELPTEESTAPSPSCGHALGDWITITKPNCTQKGCRIRYCECGKVTEKEDIPALGHDYQKDEHSASCTKDGYTEYQCSRCSAHYTEPGDKAHDHSEDQIGFITKEPTCTEKGLVVYKCIYCNETLRTEEIDMVQHVYDEHTHKCICGAEDPNYTPEPTTPTDPSEHEDSNDTPTPEPTTQFNPIKNIEGTYWKSDEYRFAIHFEKETCYACKYSFDENGNFIEGDRLTKLYNNGSYQVCSENHNDGLQYYVKFIDDPKSTELGMIYDATKRTLSGKFSSCDKCTLTFVEHEV